MAQAKEPNIVGSGAGYKLSDVREPSERPKFGALPHTVGVCSRVAVFAATIPRACLMYGSRRA